MIYRAETEEYNGRHLQYRVQNPDGSYPLQADVSAMTLYVYDTNTSTLTGTTSLVVGDTVFDTLQAWDEDGTGFNVMVAVPGAYFPDGGKTYRVEVKVTPTSGEAYYLEHVELAAEETYSA